MPKYVCCLFGYTDRRDFSVSRKPIFGDNGLLLLAVKMDTCKSEFGFLITFKEDDNIQATANGMLLIL